MRGGGVTVQLAFGSADTFAVVPADDAQRVVAAELLETQCNSDPKARALVIKGGVIDLGASLKHVLCMRLHDVSALDVTARVARECRGEREPNGCTLRSRVCAGALFEWAAQPPLQETHPVF